MSVLRADAARIMVDDVVVCPELTFTSDSDRVLFIGGSTLFSLLAEVPRNPGGKAAQRGRARLVGGSVQLMGRDIGAHLSQVGSLPRHAPLPTHWSLAEYLRWGARLAGLTTAAASERAAFVLDRFKMLGLAKKSLRDLPPLAQRAAQLAQAIVHDPKVLLLDAPYGGLSGEDQRQFRMLLEKAISSRTAMVWIDSLLPRTIEAHLFTAATDVLIIRQGRLLRQGSPRELLGEAIWYEITVHGGAEALRAALDRKGVSLDGGPTRFAAQLQAGMSASDVLSAAVESDATVVSCVPLLR